MRRLPHDLSRSDAAQPFWTANLSGMQDHFGEDAAIPKKDLDIIRDFLTSHAADAPGATTRERHYLGALLPESTPLRITPRLGGTKCTRTSTSMESSIAT
jgi:hypothetical protein